MFELILFCIVLVILFGVAIWYSFHRQQIYDEIWESIRNSLSVIADCCIDVSCAVDSTDFEGERK